MSNVLLPAPPPSARSLGPIRLAAGVVVAVLTALTAAAFALGAWNPWELVVLKQHFGNPWIGLGLVAVGSYVASWLLAPTRNETHQRGRIAVRVALAAVAVTAFIVGGLLGPQFRYSANAVAVSPDGDRMLAVVAIGGLEERQLLVWAARAPLARALAQPAQPCFRPAPRPLRRAPVAADPGFGGPPLRPAPATGQPGPLLPPRCPDPPVPATLEPCAT